MLRLDNIGQYKLDFYGMSMSAPHPSPYEQF